MATDSQKDSQKDFLSKSLYNNPNHADLVLIFNDVKYHLLSVVVQQYAPLLYAEFEKVQTPSIATSTDPTIDQMMASLTSLISRLPQRKTLTITDQTISQELVNAILETMYGKSMEITIATLSSVYTLSTKFGIEYLKKSCLEVFQKSVNVATLIEDYQKAIVEKSPLESVYKEILVGNLMRVPKDKLLSFTNQLSLKDITELITNPNLGCTEDWVWELIENRSDKSELVSYVQLEKLSTPTLLKVKSYVPLETYTVVLEKHLAQLSTLIGSSFRTGISMIALGKLNGKYPGYRLLTKKDFDTHLNKIMDVFKNDYTSNGIYCLDDLTPGVVCCAERNIAHDDHYLRVVSSHANTNIKLASRRELNSESLIYHSFYLSTINGGTDTIGLFISNIVVF